MDVDRMFRQMVNGGVLASLIHPAGRILDEFGGWPDEAARAAQPVKRETKRQNFDMSGPELLDLMNRMKAAGL